MTRFPCPYLRGEVELSDEREQHIAEHHPDLLPDHKDRIGDTLADPIRFAGACALGMHGSLQNGMMIWCRVNTWWWSLSVRLNQGTATGL